MVNLSQSWKDPAIFLVDANSKILGSATDLGPRNFESPVLEGPFVVGPVLLSFVLYWWFWDRRQALPHAR